MLSVSGLSMVLRPPGPQDVDALFALGSDPEVVRWFSWGPYQARDEAAAYVERATRMAEEGVQLDLLVVDVSGAEPRPLGITGISERSARDRRAIVGTWLAPAVWGTGANARSKALVLHLAFEVLGLVRMGAYADVRNGRSQRALEKVGFRHEGVLRAWHRHGEVSKDVAMYGLLREEWTPAADVVVEGEPPAAWR